MELQNEDIKIEQYPVVGDLQNAFASRYPFLKIDFYEADNSGRVAKPTPLASTKKLSQLPRYDANAVLDISADRTIAEITEAFFTTLGVAIQVSRKSGKVWNVITVTENWTLKTQNSAAEFISSLMKISQINP
ncbi:MAG: hypothetical protein EOO03_05320 [Chitinophagaceae bacterium]|nr:MAG: hypothetical protein EOO03_05320 [Chitinophagaceae bacterium]